MLQRLEAMFPGLERYPLDQEPLPPAEALPRLCRGVRPFLLDGAVDADGLGRISYGGCDPVAWHRDLVLEPPPPGVPFHARRAAPLQRLEEALARLQPLPLVGIISYDIGRAIERLPEQATADGMGLPPVDLAAYDALYVHDAASGESWLLAASAQAAGRLRRTLLRRGLPPGPLVCVGKPAFAIGPRTYMDMVRAVQERLQAGDCYQVNLCRRLVVPVGQTDALALYLRLRAVAPAPLGAYLRLDAPGGGAEAPVVLSNSPELLLAVDLTSGTVETRPIKGTRPRGPDPARDRALAQELQAADKDLAEHLMIVDLLRNDLGRVCQVGSVAVSGYARLLSLPTVHHLVSTVSGRLERGRGWHDLLRAMLPGGSITGAPKLRAMEVIEELEPVRRGPFYGALGWLTATAGQLSLCIRTAVVRGGELVLSVGGGIVVDSTPKAELEETEVKAAAFLRALA
ncbi:MAG: anthranilate synthase component I family protein [Myxococcales bacterium]|nr:anthranilate synthase component I family protein [Myxococcales bacterium]